MAHHPTPDPQILASSGWATRRGAPIVCLGLVLQFLVASWLRADAELAATTPARRTAHLIEVPLPITGTVDTQIKHQLEKLLAIDNTSEQRPIVILEFDSGESQSARHSEFERCLSLARFLASDHLNGVRTVAFVTSNLEGHALLPVLACEELIVNPDVEIGAAGVNEAFVDRTMRNSYADIADRRRTFPTAIAIGFVDRDASVRRVETGEGIRYVLQEDLKALAETTTINRDDSLVAPGDLVRFTGRDLRLKYHFASHWAADRGELAKALEIPINALQERSTLEGSHSALRVDIARPISAKLVNWIIASINQQTADNRFSFICVNLESAGGSANDSLRLANYLASISEQGIRTVAFVPDEARADAALIALACDELVVGPDAVLGGPGAVVIRKGDLTELQRSIRALAESRHRDWSLPTALVDPNLVVHRYVRQGTNEMRYFCAEELALQDAPREWTQDAEIAAGSGLSGHEAVDVQLATQVAEDLDEFKRLYALEGDLGVIQPNWANLLIEKLASPHLAGTILFIGLMMFMIEMSQPGIGVTGFVSAICFVLFFWSNALHGTAGWLEIMLFATGVGCLVLEIFVIPGFGIFGIGGSAMIVGSIVLASQTFVIPQNKYQIEQLPQSLFVLVAAGAGAFASVFVLRRYLPDTPILRHMLLAPAEDEDLEELQAREAVVHCEHLVGKRGKTTTRLNPAGKARFGDEIVDVIGEGELIGPGTDVHVASVRGSRVVVVPISSPAESRPV